MIGKLLVVIFLLALVGCDARNVHYDVSAEDAANARCNKLCESCGSSVNYYLLRTACEDGTCMVSRFSCSCKNEAYFSREPYASGGVDLINWNKDK